MAPHGRKDVVQLDVDSTEREEPSHEQLGHWVLVPLLKGRDLAWHLVGSAWRAVFFSDVASHNGTDDSEWEMDQDDDQGNDLRVQNKRKTWIKHTKSITYQGLRLTMMTMEGSAAVELFARATVFTNAKTPAMGTGMILAQRITFQAQSLPFSCL